MKPTGDLCSVVICTYSEERWELLLRSIDSALSQSPAPAEVIVVVDYNDALLARVIEGRGDLVVVVPNHERKGLSGARNSGVRAARSRYVAFLDDDAMAEPGWLRCLLAPFADPGVVGVGGLAVPDWDQGHGPRWLPEEFFWVVGCHYGGHRTSPGPIRNPIGANMAFAREDLISVGGFSSEFSTPPFDRCDDTEIGIRLTNRTGRTIVFEPTAIVQHNVSRERQQFSYFRRRCMLEGRAKAALSKRVGIGSAMSSEWSFVGQTLSRSVLNQLRNGVSQRSLGQFAQAGVTALGLALAAIGYIQGSTGQHRPVRTDQSLQIRSNTSR